VTLPTSAPVEAVAFVPEPPPEERSVAASAVKEAGHAIVAAVDTLLSPMPVMAFAEEAAGDALMSDGAIYRSGLVERRDVGGTVRTMDPEARPQPGAAKQPAAEVPVTPASFGEVTLSRIEIPQFNARTFLWVMIGFAALLGIVLSARQIST
jgi:hypothetical protein